jgi:alanine racemase
MDHTMIDVTDAPGASVGDPVVVFGPELGADEVATWCDTIAYEVLTAIGRRVPLVHVEEFDG